jgi:hypothetical protein
MKNISKGEEGKLKRAHLHIHAQKKLILVDFCR